MYSEGKGVEKSFSKSEQWRRKVSQNKNHTESDDGRISLWDDVFALEQKAVEYLQKSADAGCSSGMNNIGWCGHRYDENNKDVLYILTDEETMAWYKKAAAEGNAVAMSNVGNEYYEDGDYDSAMKWYIMAYANGYGNAADKIKDMLLNKQGVNGYFENYGELISANS